MGDFDRKLTTGTVYKSIRLENGPRMFLLVCVTHVDQIAPLEREFEFGSETLPWTGTLRP